MATEIFLDVNNLETFDTDNLDFKYANYKEYGIQFCDMNFENKTFRLKKSFIDKCRKEIDDAHTSMNYKRFIDNDTYTKVEIVFKNCKFSNFIIKEEDLHDDIFIEYDRDDVQINKLIIVSSKLGGKFYINKQYSGNNKSIQIKSMKIENTIFGENFKLHNSDINEFSVVDTDFNKHADFFKSKFEIGILKADENLKINLNDIGFKAINFKGLALFGDTEFKKKLIFKYVTFESFSHFRKAKLHQGLDLDYSNIQNEMNFFDVQKLETKEAKQNTSQETYRIIKHNFEKIGNKIEANKYFALELEKKMINLENDKLNNLKDYMIFKIHWLSSEFGTNWIRVLFLICLTGLITVGLIHFDLLKQLFWNPSSFKPEYIGKIKNEFFEYLYILNKNTTLISHPATLLFNKITLGYLYYQFLNSIRKDTKK